MTKTYTIQEVSDNTALTEDEIRGFLASHRVDFMTCQSIEEHEYQAILSRLDADENSPGQLVLEGASTMRQQEEQKAIVASINEYLGVQTNIAHQIVFAAATQEAESVNNAVKTAYEASDARLADWMKTRATNRVQQFGETMEKISSWTEEAQQGTADAVNEQGNAGAEALESLNEMIAAAKKTQNSRYRATKELLQN